MVEIWARAAEPAVPEYGRPLAPLIGDAAGGGHLAISHRKLAGFSVAHRTDCPVDLQAQLDAATSDVARPTSSGANTGTLIGPEDFRQTLEQIVDGEWHGHIYNNGCEEAGNPTPIEVVSDELEHALTTALHV